MPRTGRPTKLTEELLEKAWAHVDSFDVSVATLLPTVEGLALELNIHKDTLYDWAKENDDFSDVLSVLKNKQANKLLQNGLHNRYNPTIAKLLLSSKHGYIEKSEVDQHHTGEVQFTNDVPRPNATDGIKNSD